MDRKTKGKIGEERAIKFLEENGFEIVEQNYRYQRAEVDIIALLNNDLLIFVEVKLRGNNVFGHPEEFVSETQQNLILNAAEDYIHAINWTGDVRFDIIAIDKNKSIKHFVDAFG